MPVSMRHRALLLSASAYLIAANLIWIAIDDRPPFWDMAAHLKAAVDIQGAFVSDSLIGAARSILGGVTGFYPPLYQTVMAVFYGTLGQTVDAALWANMPAILILMFATYGIGRTVLSPVPAAAAAVIVNFYPLMIWLSREAMTEYWLTSMVALAMWLLADRRLADGKEAVAFGLVAGLGMLTKWTFPFFVGLPFLWVARKNVKTAAIAAAVSALVAAPWYLEQLPAVLDLLRINTSDGIGEGDPYPLSFQAVVFYVRALEGYQIFFPMFLLFLAGLVRVVRRLDPSWMPIVLWIVGGWTVLMLFQNKDPRYSVPILPAVALISAKAFEKRQTLLLALLPFLLFQHYLVSFGVAALPEKVVLSEGVSGPLSYDWNLYTQTYFGLWGAPAREDWPVERVLETVVSTDGVSVELGIVPDLPRFEPRTFELYIALRKDSVRVNRLWVFDERAIRENDYILVTEGNFGEPGSFLFTPDRERIAEYLIGRPESFRVVDMFVLPSGESILLYRVET